MRRRITALSCRVLPCVPLLLAAPAANAFLSVGVAGSRCAFPTTQNAIDALIASEGKGDFGDTFIVVAGGPYKEALEINGAQASGFGLVSISASARVRHVSPEPTRSRRIGRGDFVYSPLSPGLLCRESIFPARYLGAP